MIINLQEIQDKWETHLEIDALYFHAARKAQVQAEFFVESIRVAENRFASICTVQSVKAS